MAVNLALPVFEAIVERVGAQLRTEGMTGKGRLHWRTGANGDLFAAIELRRVPYPSDKRIMFLATVLIGDRRLHDAEPAQARGRFAPSLRCAQAQIAVVDGNKQKLWSVFPSTDPAIVAADVFAVLAEQALPRVAVLVDRARFAAELRRGEVSAGNPETNSRFADLLDGMKTR